jgi:hypothetical protein
LVIDHHPLRCRGVWSITNKVGGGGRKSGQRWVVGVWDRDWGSGGGRRINGWINIKIKNNKNNNDDAAVAVRSATRTACDIRGAGTRGPWRLASWHDGMRHIGGHDACGASRGRHDRLARLASCARRLVASRVVMSFRVVSRLRVPVGVEQRRSDSGDEGSAADVLHRARGAPSRRCSFVGSASAWRGRGGFISGAASCGARVVACP